MTIATGLVGAFGTAGQFWTRSGIVVQASNSHSDFFVKNLVAIRAEQRGLLTVYRPSAFAKVTGLKTGLTAPAGAPRARLARGVRGRRGAAGRRTPARRRAEARRRRLAA